MIPAVASDTEMDRYVSNIVRCYRSASPEQLARGTHWYRVAHDLARVLGDGDARKGAGVLAALSPLKDWTKNCELARLAAETGKASGQVGDACRKAEAILNGIDPADVLPMALKTGNFYRSILDPGDPDPVTIDRHAHDVAVGERYVSKDRGLGSKRRYATLAHAYRCAARELGKFPSVVQAVTWCVQVDTYQYQRKES